MVIFTLWYKLEVPFLMVDRGDRIPLRKPMSSVFRASILYKMEIANGVSAFQNYQHFSDVMAERPEPGSANSEPMKSEYKNSEILYRLWRHVDHAE